MVDTRRGAEPACLTCGSVIPASNWEEMFCSDECEIEYFWDDMDQGDGGEEGGEG